MRPENSSEYTDYTVSQKMYHISFAITWTSWTHFTHFDIIWHKCYR